MTPTELVATKPQLDPEFAQPQKTSIIQYAIERGAGIDTIERLIALKEREDENQARRAFNVAFAEFKAEAVTLLRTKKYTDGPLKAQKHVELGEIVKVSTPALAKHGLSISWKLTKDSPEWMEVTCVLRHIAGHSETVSMGGAPDTGPGRNAIQARGSAKTYLERYTATAILGLAPEDEDTDGVTPAHVEAITERQQIELQTWAEALRGCPSPEVLKSEFARAHSYAKSVSPKAASKMTATFNECLARFK
jgi:hypothetical protein